MRSPLAPIAKLSSKSSKKSDSATPNRLIPLGRVVNTHGVRGELRFLPYAFPCQTLAKEFTVFLQRKDGQESPFTLTSLRVHRPFLLLKLAGIDSRDAAEALRETVLAVDESCLPPLQDGEFYYYQVIGLQVRTTTNQDLGVITQVFFSGGHDIWVVQQGKKEYLIPVTEEIVQTIDLASGIAVIEPLPGLLD
jgi:16S rRNA processing protein RimM